MPVQVAAVSSSQVAVLDANGGLALLEFYTKSTVVKRRPLTAFSTPIAVSNIVPTFLAKVPKLDALVVLASVPLSTSTSLLPYAGGGVAVLLPLTNSSASAPIGEISFGQDGHKIAIPPSGISQASTRVTFAAYTEIDAMAPFHSSNTTTFQPSPPESTSFETWPCPQTVNAMAPCSRINLAIEHRTTTTSLPFTALQLLGNVSGFASLLLMILRTIVVHCTSSSSRKKPTSFQDSLLPST